LLYPLSYEGNTATGRQRSDPNRRYLGAMSENASGNAPRMPGEFEPHERTIMCWPTRDEIWGDHHRQAELDYTEIASAIARFEPVTMVASPEDAEVANDLCGSIANIEVVEIAIDDSWARDSGPIYVIDRAGRAIADFTFTAWGHKFEPFNDDARLVERWAARRKERRIVDDMVLEGGALSTDGEGTFMTTQQCLMHLNRNPSMTRTQIENVLATRLGAEVLHWLPYGHSLDDDTDGHVDNIGAFVRPGVVMLQGCDDPVEVDHERLRQNRRWIEGALDAKGRATQVVEVPVLPFTELDGQRICVPYLNFYVCNNAVIVPTVGHAADADICALIAETYQRQVVAVPGAVLALGGGGPHCITQQVPAER
jgi:agmatine deiminase